jgi:hypothetical protein
MNLVRSIEKANPFASRLFPAANAKDELDLIEGRLRYPPEGCDLEQIAAMFPLQLKADDYRSLIIVIVPKPTISLRKCSPC